MPTVLGPPPDFTLLDNRDFFGLNTYFTGLERIPPLNNDGEDGIAQLIGLGRETGAAWAREEISWGNLERHRKNGREWYLYDDRLLQIDQAGYQIIGMFSTTPDWARVEDCAIRVKRFEGISPTVPETYWCPPANVEDFADIVRATVERYDADGVGDAFGSPRVDVWQMWNEPNAWETWPGTPEEYGRLLLAGYKAAKEADPDAVVTVGGVYVFDGSWDDGRGHQDGLLFMNKVLQAVPEAWQAFDVLPIHPYMPDVAPDHPDLVPSITFWGRIVTAQNWLANKTQQYGGTEPRLWIGEVGWPTCSNTLALASNQQDGLAELARYRLPSLPQPAAQSGLAPASDWLCHSEEEQAAYLVRSHTIALALGVEHLNYLQLEDKFDGSYYPVWGATSIVATKSQNYRQKAGYTAYRQMIVQLRDAQFVGFGPLHSYQHSPEQQRAEAARYHMRFSLHKEVIDVLWSTGGSQEVSLALEPGHTATLLSKEGAQLPLAMEAGEVSFAIGSKPVYLRQTQP